MEERIVYKYTRPVADSITLTLPRGAELLHVADQEGSGRQLDFWALVDRSETEEEERQIGVLGTGHPTPHPGAEGFAHWETVVTAGGSLVWHVFLDHNGARGVPTF